MEQPQVVRETSTTALMRNRWLLLGKMIADATRSLDVVDGNKPKGKLTILGSGLSHSDLSIEIEDQIRNADKVFFSINDLVTKTWLNSIRSDAYDLAILYDEKIGRQATYTRMSESILHFVRQGQTVVTIFYGHPGIFAAPGHRAIQIARKEGHTAHMRPGISALDCLIADVGFDPGLPGMITYEATDMLLRRRRLDPTLHTVLWQVGVIGEFGYNRRGYGNAGLPLLIETLEDVYGPSFQLVHYIGAQYAGAKPLIERQSIASLRDERNAKRLTTLSTFYLPPSKIAETDDKRALALNAPRKRKSSATHGDLTRYGPRELETLNNFSKFQPSAGYEVKGWNPLLRFLMCLTQDLHFRQRFESDPVTVLDGPEGSELTELEKSLLCARDQRAVAVAAIESS